MKKLIKKEIILDEVSKLDLGKKFYRLFLNIPPYKVEGKK